MATALPPYLEAQLTHIDDDRRTAFVASNAVCMLLAWLAVGLRFLARYCSTVRCGWDDWTMIPALILHSALAIISCISVLFGSARHQILQLQNAGMAVPTGKITLSSEIMYNPTLFIIKLSIIFLYARIFPNRTFRLGLWAVGIFIAAYTICAMVISLTQCDQLDVIWDLSGSGICRVDMVAAIVTIGALNTTTDFAILMMPLPMIWNLHTNWITKAQVSGLFLTGALVTVISIVRLVYTSRITPEDVAWSITDAAAWTVAEVSAAIISACLPIYRPLFDRAKRKASRQCFWPSRIKECSKTGDKDAGDVGDIGEPLRKIRVQRSISNT